MNCRGTPPSPRFCHAAVAINKCIYIHGGQCLVNRSTKSEFESTDDLYCLDTTSLTWTYIKPQGGEVPAPRNSHTAVIINGNIVIYGGANSKVGPLGDLWEFNVRTNTWRKIQCKGDVTPGAREMHSASVLSKNEENIGTSCMYIVGGRKANGDVSKDAWMLNSGELVIPF